VREGGKWGSWRIYNKGEMFISGVGVYVECLRSEWFLLCDTINKDANSGKTCIQ